MENGEWDRPSERIIAEDWERFTGGPPVVGVLREYQPSDLDGLRWRDPMGEAFGLVTWWIDGEVAEIVSLHASPEGSGKGPGLLDAAEAELKRRGVKRVTIATTNDNPRALNFYVRQGYRLVRLHLDAMDRVREAKPGVPSIGRDGIPLRDMWELEKEL